MTDTKYNETRIVAAKAIKNKIELEKHDLPISALRVFILENYGIGSRWVDNYVKDLEAIGYLSLQYDTNNKVSRINKPKFDKRVYQ